MKFTAKFKQSIKLGINIFFILMLCQNLSIGQDGINYNSEDAYKGYTLCNAEAAGTTYLLDNCGEIVNKWTNVFPDHYCRLTEEGTLIYISGNSIVEKNWNNNVIKVVTPNASNLALDYEVIKLENGNFLAVARRLVNSSFFEGIGWDPNVQKPDRVDSVVELDQNGNIVWEWNIADHTIQDKISTAPNYGVIKDHPELVDVNAISDYDWQYGESFMINSFDYNQELDQILISVRKVSEFMIIDHSTTTAEAKGSTGGNSGKGGDILYRWGNPQNYDQGNSQDRVLYFQHNPNWVKYGDHKGKIIVYNNGLTRPGSYSSVHIVNPPLQSDGNYTLQKNQAYEPADADVTIDKFNSNNNFYSGYTSGAQVLPNGNIYITVGQPSDFIEVKTDGTVVWEYTLDFSYYIFRTEKYAPDFPGFDGKDLEPSGTVESPSSSYNCLLYTSTKDLLDQGNFDIQFDQLSNNLTILKVETEDNILEIRNNQGQLIQSLNNITAGTQINVDFAPSGLYYITLNAVKRNNRITRKIVKF